MPDLSKSSESIVMRPNEHVLRRTALGIAALLFLLSALPLRAQRTHFGANAGLSLAFFRGPENLIGRKNEQYAYRAGVSIAYDLSRRLSIQSGLEFWTKGFDGSLSSYGQLMVITPVRLRVRQLALPLILSCRLGQSVFFGAGAYLAQRIGGQLTLFRAENDLLKPRELGYILGVGTSFRLLRRDQVLEIQWRQGLTPVFTLNDDKFFFSTLSLLYGLRF
jgi:hypothetical protein